MNPKIIFSAILTILFAVSVLTFTSCDKDDNFCIDNVLAESTADIEENVSIKIPDGETYTGIGAIPGPILSIGKYNMTVTSVITKQTPTQTGMDVELVHLWDDGNGNAFWTNDQAVMTPLDTTLTIFNVYDEMTVADGTGDFECASGKLINEGVVNFATYKLDFKVTGNVCGGCD